MRGFIGAIIIIIQSLSYKKARDRFLRKVKAWFGVQNLNSVAPIENIEMGVREGERGVEEREEGQGRIVETLGERESVESGDRKVRVGWMDVERKVRRKENVMKCDGIYIIDLDRET